MKISILTAAYNRCEAIDKLYQSLVRNSNSDAALEWLIMDDGSTDNTKTKIEEYIASSNFEIKYFYQENQGKMAAINNLIEHVTGDLIVECDSDDYWADNAIRIITAKYADIKDLNNIYAMVFLKYDKNLCNIGSAFKDDKYKSTMFDLYFKDGITGDKALVFIADIRKQYKYILEKNEKFVTEARMFNQMDVQYNVICFNHPIMICEYLNEGYSNNILKVFKGSPYGYLEYFKALFDFDMKGISPAKRLYIIKHYILFCYLTKQKHILSSVKGGFNKFLTSVLIIPGYIKSYFMFK